MANKHMKKCSVLVSSTKGAGQLDTLVQNNESRQRFYTL